MLMLNASAFFYNKSEVDIMATKKSTSTKKKSSSSSSKTVNTVVKASKKMAKSNPKVFAILVIVVILLVGAGIGGYFAYKYFNPDIVFALKGGKQVSVGLETTYKEKGVTAKYNGKDISDKVEISY